MTEISHFTYESNTPIETSDNYFLRVKAHVVTEKADDKQIQSSINSSSMSFFKQISLFEAFGMLENKKSDLRATFHRKVIDDCKKNQIEIKSFVLATIDAVQGATENQEINLEINPELEGKKKKKGIFSKLFGKS